MNDVSPRHFFRKLALATPTKGFPFEPTAFSSQHFLIKLVRAAPASGLPSLPTAFDAQELWPAADPIATSSIRIAVVIQATFFIAQAASLAQLYSGEHRPSLLFFALTVRPRIGQLLPSCLLPRLLAVGSGDHGMRTDDCGGAVTVPPTGPA